MAAPYEEPAKAEMRARCAIAVDQAGYEFVEDLVSVSLPQNAGLQGAIRGDIQSLDSRGIRSCYYLRTQKDDNLPKWLANLAIASHKVEGVAFYVVVESASPAFEVACKRSGAGLLVLTVDNIFEHVISFEDVAPESASERFRERETKMRRALEFKIDLKLKELQDRLVKLRDLTSGMTPDVSDKYLESVERQHGLWQEWGDSVGRQLDAAFTSRSEAELDIVEREIDAGPTLDDDVQ